MWALTLSGMGLFEVQKRRGGVVFLQPQLTFLSTVAVKISLSQYNHQPWQKLTKKIEVVLGQVSRCYDVRHYHVCQKPWIFNKLLLLTL